MRRSTSLKLVLMASGAVVVNGCDWFDPQTEGKVYRTVEQCINEGLFNLSECDESFREASRTHQMSAPRYDSATLCQNQHGVGNCEARESYWRPFMTAFFISSLIDTASRRDDRTRPLYTSAVGGLYTSDGYGLRRDPGTGNHKVSTSTYKSAPKVAKVQTRTTVAARGGFGSRASVGGS